ncbi:hypothetical protein ANN_17504 [Periplaneta americana]|uniref:Uncharacterized protein n=1 Tax=Periplaneta americana TaxID=6978 RepID=A0ABQ8STP9_PERAM|nr:hypothetical protein ANN_17504 [Periplaneta americana]
MSPGSSAESYPAFPLNGLRRETSASLLNYNTLEVVESHAFSDSEIARLMCHVSKDYRRGSLHDDTLVHFFRNEREHLTVTFQDRWIDLGSPTPWSARSPRLLVIKNNQQDGAPPLDHQRVREFLDEKFPDRSIGKRGPLACPPSSPDPIPFDCFFWGFVKNAVYQRGRANTLEELRQRSQMQLR